VSKTASVSGALRSALKFRHTYSLKHLRQRGWEDGILGGEKRWLALGVVAWTAWVVQWAWRREPEVIYRTKLKPGESVTIATAKPSPKGKADGR
jgi:hypothetical protein